MEQIEKSKAAAVIKQQAEEILGLGKAVRAAELEMPKLNASMYQFQAVAIPTFTRLKEVM